MTSTPDTHYLKTSDGVYIAYQVVGEGPVDVAMAFSSQEANVDLMWEDPEWRPFLTGTAEFGRLILHDRRGTGVSSRNVPVPNLETRVADLLAVLDEVGSNQPILMAPTEPGAMHALFAATHPDRVSGMVWVNPSARMAWAPDYEWGLGPDVYKESVRQSQYWGTVEFVRTIADWRAAERAGIQPGAMTPVEHDRELLNLYARINRNTATPDVALALNKLVWETDVRGILPAARTPTALVVGSADEMDEEAQFLASVMPNATVHVVPGRAGVAVKQIMAITRELAGIHRSAPMLDTVLATVLFTDIVDSSARQAALGDRAWKALVLAHHERVRRALDRWRGVENDTAGDGFYATFDGPARAIRCALDIAEQMEDLGIQIRAGLHTGECELIDGKHGGLTVSIGARVASTAGSSEVLISQTVKDLVAGSGFLFEDRGEHTLKGIPENWRLYRVAEAGG
ncbi:MAG TPA: adenylate/guanylate cyclase domain-containing protein [Candidatus Limnocylindrales bacterium]|nr:adenylate/guanylate cyclase domain-containing protein [Candidatus Limnocylindrales bacterium]